MTTPQIEAFVRQIRDKLPTHDTPEQAAQALRQDITSMGISFSEEMEQSLTFALEQVVASLEDVEILRRNSLVKKRDPWYTVNRPGFRGGPNS
ncbi:hypothetical protein TUM18999_21600 [Pseudomonas tohonis]|uniref:Uncharacterized protein n=1 Tax=Pseudomonas tohonis TaxID=2725477 RepID=A0A6J4E3N1_9PSED|nr:hypothetical protein [Pseudomonas tohonis]BCG23969.1 hypothetical protein TUM18999_21600 [Pseudomonas tohonis]